MRFDIFTVLPDMFGGLQQSILGRAAAAGLVEFHVHNIRDWAQDRHKTTDDYPYGGGAGMVFKPEPVFAAVESVLGLPPVTPATPVYEAQTGPIIVLSPQGQPFSQAIARELATFPRLTLICGHYEGYDERIVAHLATREISIGDYVLTGGELAAMVVADAVARLVPGVLAEGSADDESFSRGLLEYPQYTRPPDFRGWPVPDILLSGHHAKVADWRFSESLRRTLRRRPELLAAAEGGFDKKERKLAAKVREEEAVDSTTKNQ